MSDPAERQARRRFLKIAVVGAAVAPVAAALLPRVAGAQDSAPHLDTSDPTAKALAYTEDANTAKGNPVYKEGSTCAGCNFYKGHTEMTYGPCDLFPGKVVSAKGWCASWTKKV